MDDISRAPPFKNGDIMALPFGPPVADCQSGGAEVDVGDRLGCDDGWGAVERSGSGRRSAASTPQL